MTDTLAFGYLITTALIAVTILSGRSLYPRWAVLVSPLGIAAISAIVIALLPAGSGGLKTFLSLTGLNLPLMMFFPVTGWVLARGGEFRLAL